MNKNNIPKNTPKTSFIDYLRTRDWNKAGKLVCAIMAISLVAFLCLSTGFAIIPHLIRHIPSIVIKISEGLCFLAIVGFAILAKLANKKDRDIDIDDESENLNYIIKTPSVDDSSDDDDEIDNLFRQEYCPGY